MFAATDLPDLHSAIKTLKAADPCEPFHGPAVVAGFVDAVRALRRMLTGGNSAHVLRAAELLCRVWMARRRHRARPRSAADEHAAVERRGVGQDLVELPAVEGEQPDPRRVVGAHPRAGADR